MAPAVVNDAGRMTRSKGSKSTRRRESHNNRLPYDDHVMSKQGSLMYFEENKRRPSKMVKQQQLVRSKRQERDERKTTEGQMSREKNPQQAERGEHDA